MAQILIRNVNEDTVKRLRRYAREEGRSLEAKVRMILEQAAFEPKLDMATVRKRLEQFRKRFKGRKFPDSAALIREDRDNR